MTNEQAIEMLSKIRSGYNLYNDSERPFYHALSMAIETLQARASRNYEPILTEAEQYEVLNAIIDALPSYQVDGYADNNGMFFDVFISKPVHPSCSESPNRSDTIYRQDAIDVAKQHWYKPDIAKALEELPSAQPEDAIAELRKELNGIILDSWIWSDLVEFKSGRINADDVISEVNRLYQEEISKIFAEYTQREGEWVYVENDYGYDGWRCNQCGYWISWDYHASMEETARDLPAYCPDCYADMR